MDNRRWLKGKKIPLKYRKNPHLEMIISIVKEPETIPNSWILELAKGDKGLTKFRQHT